MKKIAIVGLLALGSFACGDDENGNGDGDALTLDTPNAINTYLEGKTLLMEGDNIPSHPNGYDEDDDSNVQCYHKSTITISGGAWTVTSNPGERIAGDCDHDTALGDPYVFTSTNVLVENVQGNGECFDLTVTYTGFAQEGRAGFNAEGTQLTLELFFAGEATGHRCTDGVVGEQTVTLNSAAFTGDAQQVYVVQ